MRAVRVTRLGDPEVLTVAQVAVPEPGPGQVRIAMRASGVNFAETLQRQGRYPGVELPWIPGNEVAGVVDAVSSGSDGVTPGDRVVARVSWGGYAEYVLADAAEVVALPDTLDFGIATVAAVHAPTALVLVRHVAPVAPGQTVLVHAAAGGIGSLLVQLLAGAGAVVIAAASDPAKLGLCTALGAAVTVDYSRRGWVEQVRAATGGRGVDVVLATAAGQIFSESVDVLAPLGHLVIWGAANTEGTELIQQQVNQLIYANQRVSGYAFPTYPPATVRAAGSEAVDLLASGALTATIGGRYPLHEVGRAHEDIEARTTTGKLVIVP